jgi:hypothetical protein
LCVLLCLSFSWAFSSSDCLSSIRAIRKKVGLTRFSPQYLVDCAKTALPAFGGGHNNGCSGGAAEYTYNWLLTHKHVTEKAYPYKGKQGSCRNTAKTSVSTKTNPTTAPYGYVRATGAAAIRNLIATGPAVVGVDASNTFMHYKSGILTAAGCGTAINHAVLAVGYGSTGGKAYWLIKNSWSTAWGEKGYIRLRRGQNTCGVESFAVQPYL